eukprot:ctg_5906.g585
MLSRTACPSSDEEVPVAFQVTFASSEFDGTGDGKIEADADAEAEADAEARHSQTT